MPKDLVSLSDCARRLRVSVRTVQRAVNGRVGPGLKTRKRGGRRHVSLTEAREYLRKHSKASVKPSASGEAPAADATAVAEELAAKIPSDPEAVLRKLSTDIALLNDLGPAVARVMVAACEGHRRAKAAETKAADMLTSEQFAKDLRACMRVFVEHQAQHGARRLAARIVAVLREQLSVDLTAHAGAQSVLSYTILEDLNVGIAELRQAIDDAIAAKGG